MQKHTHLFFKSTGLGNMKWRSRCRKHTEVPQKIQNRSTTGPSSSISGDTSEKKWRRGIRATRFTAAFCSTARREAAPCPPAREKASHRKTNAGLVGTPPTCGTQSGQNPRSEQQKGGCGGLGTGAGELGLKGDRASVLQDEGFWGWMAVVAA